MQTIGLIDGTARLHEFVAAFREKGLMVVHDRAAARDDCGPNGIQTSVRKPPGAKPGGLERVMSEASIVQGTAWPILVHSLRTAITCVVSLLVARLFRLPEAYWAPITTVVITQSSLGAALAVSWHRFLGTVLGALVGAAMATYVGPHAVAFGIGLFVLGLIRIVTHSDLTGYRFGGVALAIVLLVPRTGPAWQIAFHRFVEVSIGIGVALMFSMVWRERDAGTR